MTAAPTWKVEFRGHATSEDLRRFTTPRPWMILRPRTANRPPIWHQGRSLQDVEFRVIRGISAHHRVRCGNGGGTLFPCFLTAVVMVVGTWSAGDPEPGTSSYDCS